MRLTYPLRRLAGAALGASLAVLCIVIAGALVGAHHIAIQLVGERNAP